MSPEQWAVVTEKLGTARHKQAKVIVRLKFLIKTMEEAADALESLMTELYTIQNGVDYVD